MAVLFVECFPLILVRLMFPYRYLCIRMGLSIICFKGSQVDFLNKCVLQSMHIAVIIANSADPDGKQQTNKLPFQGFPVYKGFIHTLS